MDRYLKEQIMFKCKLILVCPTARILERMNCAGYW